VTDNEDQTAGELATTTDLAAASAPVISSKGRVVVGVDGSPLSLEALRYAAEIAEWRGWALHIVHAYHVYYPAWPVPGAVGVPSDFDATVTDAALAALKAEEAAVLGTDHELEVIHSVVDGQAAHVLVHVSEHADLLVLGSRGLGGMRSLVLGSVGNSVVHHAHCPVLIVRPTSKAE